MTIIDTHTHLDHLKDLEQALEAAYEAGVERIITTGIHLEANKRNLQIKCSTARPRIFVALGLHPSDIKTEEIEETLTFIEENIAEAVAIGETGLDYWYQWVKKDPQKKEEQREVFRRQLEIAKKNDLPAIIHSRGAWRDCWEIAKAAGISNAVFHWYSGPVDILKEILGQGFYVSATPSLAYSPQAREAIAAAPIEQTLIETDTPVYYKEGEAGFSSQPKDVLRTLRIYCELKGLEEQEAAEIFNHNARKLFQLN